MKYRLRIIKFLEITNSRKIVHSITILLSSIIASLCCCHVALAQVQLGEDIDGEAAGDISGSSVSLSADGDCLAIGAPRNDGSGEDSGHVRVYQWTGAAWVQLGDDIDGESAGDNSGRLVSLSSDCNRLAVGAVANKSYTGHVRIYQWSGAAWEQLGEDIDGKAEDTADFGLRVSLNKDGSRLAVGSPRTISGPGMTPGMVRVYQWQTSIWTQLGNDIDGEAIDDNFGSSVSLSSDGNRLAVGATGGDGNENDSGCVRVYRWTGTTWARLGGDIGGQANQDAFGWSVSLSSRGNRVAIGAPSNDSGENESGQVRVYRWADEAWVQMGEDINGDVAGAFSGESVSLSADGNRLAVGAPQNGPGDVRMYYWTGEAWVQFGADIIGEKYADDFGSSVSLNSDGSRLAVGAIWNDGNGDASGHVRIFDLSMFNTFRVNAGLSDAWYYPETSGQGFFITVFPDLGYVSLAWFTYDTELPSIGATANLGDPGHRWLTAVGPIEVNQVLMDIEMTSGGIFDTATEIQRTDPPGSDGTITLTFDSCNSGTVEYDILSINRQGIVPIQRVADDNIALCEALNSN